MCVLCDVCRSQSVGRSNKSMAAAAKSGVKKARERREEEEVKRAVTNPSSAIRYSPPEELHVVHVCVYVAMVTMMPRPYSLGRVQKRGQYLL